MSYTVTNLTTTNVNIGVTSVVPGGTEVVNSITPQIYQGQQLGLLSVVANPSTLPSDLHNPTSDDILLPLQALHAADGGVTVVTDAAALNFNAALSSNFQVTLSASGHVVENPTNLIAGQTIHLELIQGTGGNKTVTWGTLWTFPGGTLPTLSTAAGAVDVITAWYDGTALRATAGIGFAT